MIAAILFILYFVLIIWLLNKLPLFLNSGLSYRGLTILFGIKLLFAIALVLVYTYYYTERTYADIYKYFDDANVICESAAKHPKAFVKILTGINFDRDNETIKEILANTHHFDKKGGGFLESTHRLIIRFNIILRFISTGSIYIHSLFFCFLSFIGLVALYRALGTFFEGNKGRLLILPIFLLPSVLFWSSGLLKETLVIFFLGLLVFTALKVLELRNILANLLLTILCLYFLFLLKPFIALSFIVSYYFMATFYLRGYARIISLLLASCGALWFFYAHDAFVCELMSSIITKRNEFISLGLQMKAGSLVSTDLSPQGCLEPLRLLPGGMYNMFFEPFVWSHGLFEKIFGIENLFILLLTIYTLFRAHAPRQGRLQLLVFCGLFFLFNYCLIGVTVPIIGALVRYKIFGLIFYMICLLRIINLNKFISDINSVLPLRKLLFFSQKQLFKETQP